MWFTSNVKIMAPRSDTNAGKYI